MQSDNLKLKTAIIFLTVFFGILFFAKVSQATTYYISPTGTDSGSCTIGSPCLSLHYAQTKLTTAGDILYCRGGTYTATDDYFNAQYSGSTGNYISIKNYPGETPIFRSSGSSNPGGGAYGVIYTNGQSWLWLEGLEFRPTGNVTNSRAVMVSSPSSNIYFKSCTFVANLTDPVWNGTRYETWYTWTTNTMRVDGNYFTLDSCTINGAGDTTDPQGNSGSQIGVFGNYGIYKNNFLTNGVHDTFFLEDDTPGVWASYNEIRNNTIDSQYGYGLNAYSPNHTSTHNLYEGNIIYNVAKNIDYVKTGIYLRSMSDMIIRNNVVYNVGLGNGYLLSLQGASATMNNNKIYNNTFYNSSGPAINHYNDLTDGKFSGNKLYNNVFMKGMQVKAWGGISYDFTNNSTDNHTYSLLEFKNNVMISYVSGTWQDDYANVYDSKEEIQGGKKVYKISEMETGLPSNWANNKYMASTCDPKFIDPSTGNFNTQSGSCLIDAGRHLTTTNGSGSNSTTLIVNDAGFFWPGDILQTFGTISSINYGTNTITLASPKSWSNGDNVDLAYNGNAPDIGAFESLSSASDTTPPAAPTGVSVN